MASISIPLAWAGIYVALLILGAVVLQALVIRQRFAKQVGIGTGGHQSLALAVRVHGNYTENVPFGMVGLVVLALLGASALYIHLVGILLVAGRIAHAAGLGRSAGTSPGRFLGVVATAIALALAAIGILVQAARLL